MQNLRGTGVALVTPFYTNKTIDFDSLTKLVEYTITGGVDFLVILGTTAESATLTDQEKEEVLKHIVKVTKQRIPLVLGVGGNNTAAVVAQLKSLDTEGLTAILSVSPSYNKPTQEGIYRHFEAISNASPLPIILYNVPSRTGSNMLPETTLRLANDFENIVGIKEAVNDMGQILRLLANRPDGFLVLSGDDLLALPLVTAGGDGVISVVAQGIPLEFSMVIRDGLNHAFAKAYKNLTPIIPLIDLIFSEGNPAGIKELLSQRGICESEVRLPLVKASATLEKQIRIYKG